MKQVMFTEFSFVLAIACLSAAGAPTAWALLILAVQVAYTFWAIRSVS